MVYGYGSGRVSELFSRGQSWSVALGMWSGGWEALTWGSAGGISPHDLHGAGAS